MGNDLSFILLPSPFFQHNSLCDNFVSSNNSLPNLIDFWKVDENAL